MKNVFEKIHRYTEQNFVEGKPFEFILHKNNKNEDTDWLCPPIKKMEIGKVYSIFVKPYMTEPSTSNFDFQDKWNDGVPMPQCRMEGKVIKETRGMYYMELKTGDITWEGWVIKSAIKEWEEI